MPIHEKFTLTDAFAAVSRIYDVLVIGGGIAGLCAALAAREQGASVAILEKTGETAGGGNSRHASRMLLPGKGISTDDYAALFSRPLQLAHGKELSASAPYVDALGREAAGLAAWLQARGVALPHAGCDLPGGGKALMNALYTAAETAGIAIARNAAVSCLDLRDGQISGVSFPLNGAEQRVRARTVVLACGGVTERPAHVFLRGGAANDGAVVRLLESLPCGAPRMLGGSDIARYIPVDARAPEVDGGIAVSFTAEFFQKAVFSGSDGSVLPARMTNAEASAGPDSSEALYWGAALATRPDGKATAALAAPDAAALPLYFPPLVVNNADDPSDEDATRTCTVPLVAALDTILYGPALDEAGSPVIDGVHAPRGLFAAGEAVFANIPYAALYGPDNGTTLAAAALSGILAGRSAVLASAAAPEHQQTAEVAHAG